MHERHIKVLFITGAYLHHSCWDEWKVYFEKKGFECLVPNWPQKQGTIHSLWQRNPDRLLAELTFTDLITQFKQVISEQNPGDMPVLVGHSTGGLIVQLLLEQGLGSAGIAIQSAPPFGVLSLDLSYLRSHMGPLALSYVYRKPYVMSFNHWQYTFTNGLAEPIQRSLYKAFLTPESRGVISDTFAPEARVNYNRKHAPLLVIAGGEDHMAPAALNYNNYKKYLHNPSLTEYKEFCGRSHFSIRQSGWEEIADYIVNWITIL